MNQPDRVGQWVLSDAEMKITDDTMLPGSILVQLNCSDHTIGNLLRSQLLLDANVLFAGYRLPHPQSNTVELRIQTDPNMNPYVSPRKAMLRACVDLAMMTKELRKSFETQASDLEVRGTAMGGVGGIGNGLGAGAVQAGDPYAQPSGYDAYGAPNQGGVAAEDPYEY